MDYKDLYMLVQDVFSGGLPSMDMMLLPRKNPQAKHATVCQNGVVSVVGLGARKERPIIQKRRRQSTEKHQSRSMHLRISRRESKVTN